MRDETIYAMFREMQGQINNVINTLRVIASGDAIQNEAFKSLLIQKGTFTEEEYTKAISNVLQEINKQKDNTQGLVKPTPEDVAATDASKVVEDKK